jgi:hypothetical protein
MNEFEKLQREIQDDRKRMSEGKMTPEEAEKKIAYHKQKAADFMASAAALEKYSAARGGLN